MESESSSLYSQVPATRPSSDHLQKTSEFQFQVLHTKCIVTQAVLVCLYFFIFKFITTCVDKGRQQQCSTNNHHRYGDPITVNETSTACRMQQWTDDAYKILAGQCEGYTKLQL
jgi:hypothetical protein